MVFFANGKARAREREREKKRINKVDLLSFIVILFLTKLCTASSGTSISYLGWEVHFADIKDIIPKSENASIRSLRQSLYFQRR